MMTEQNKWSISPMLPLIPITLIIVLCINKIFYSRKSTKSSRSNLPKSYPIIGHLLDLYKLKTSYARLDWISSNVNTSPTSTFVLHRPLGGQTIFTGNPATVEHVLKTRFPIYQKGPHTKDVYCELFGNSMFNENGDTWKFQRQISIHQFSPKSLRRFVDKVLDYEISERLLPILSEAANARRVIDLQDVLQRLAFDNVCMIAFGFDPASLSPTSTSASQQKQNSAFAEALEDAAVITFTTRSAALYPILWKIRRFLNVGSERKLKNAIAEIRDFATRIVRQRKQQEGIISSNPLNSGTAKTTKEEDDNVLLRLLKHDELNEKVVVDIVIAFILAGRDTTSAALTWFFWLLHHNKRVEQEIIKEIKNNSNNNKSCLEEIRSLTYTHAALCEAMRLYPPAPLDTKQAVEDDILPDGTIVKKGMLVTYVMYAMGRSEKLWGSDWAVFRPERWLEEELVVEYGSVSKKWRFVPCDSYTYPVFNAGPRTCLGKEMAFLQMKRVVAAILGWFRVVPTAGEGFEPVYVPAMTAKMEGGLPVRILEKVV